MYQYGEEVIHKCFSEFSFYKNSIILQNPTRDAWTGQIVVTKDGLKINLICTNGCTNKQNVNDDNRVDVDGNADSKNHAPDSPWCLNGNACTFEPSKKLFKKKKP